MNSDTGKVFKPNAVKVFTIIASVVFAAMMTVEKINGRFWLNDFKVMYLAAEAFMNGDQVYGLSFGLSTGFYKYSPFTLLFFVPYTIFPYEIANMLHFAVIAFCTISTIITLVRLLARYLPGLPRIHFLTLLSIFLCILLHLVRELHLGNTNIILIFLLTLILKFTMDGKYIRSGAILAIVVLTKPYFIVCALPFLLHKKYKSLISLAISLFAFVMIPAVFLGWTKNTALYSEWVQAMGEHSGYLSSNHTISSLMNTYFGLSLPADYSLYPFGAAALLLFIYFWLNYRYGSSPKGETSLIIYYFTLIAIIPNLLITDTEHFLFSMPLISILVLLLAKSKNYLWISLFIILIFLYEGNSSDLLGRDLSGKFDLYGILGIGNLILIATVFFLHRQKKLG